MTDAERGPLTGQDAQGASAPEPEQETAGRAETQAAEEELNEVQKRVRAYSDKRWRTMQIVCGALLGAACGALLTFFGTSETTGVYATGGALLIALVAPNMAEKRLRRPVRQGRVAMIISLAVWLAITTAVALLSGETLIQ